LEYIEIRHRPRLVGFFKVYKEKRSQSRSLTARLFIKYKKRKDSAGSDDTASMIKFKFSLDYKGLQPGMAAQPGSSTDEDY
jgi:hypothetical protein